jgi:branched-chain amino acid transport system substrate-binding protein
VHFIAAHPEQEVSMATTRWTVALALLAALVTAAGPALAQTVGVTATEIKVGNTNPYSGAASAYGTIGKVITAYFKKVNDEGGINGRKVNFITYDDGYTPPKTVEMVRRLVEQDQVAFVFQTLGTPSNSAIHKYMNQQKVPHLFVATGATKWGDPKNFPWTMGFQPNYQTEGRIYAAYILKNVPDAKVGILYQNDDYGKDYITGVEAGLGSKVSNIVDKEPFEVTAASVGSQIAKLKASGATIFMIFALPLKTIQAYATANALKWSPDVIYTNSVAATDTIMTLARTNGGGDLVEKTFSVQYAKDPANPSWDNDNAMKLYKQVMGKYYPKGRVTDGLNYYGVAVAHAFVQLLYAAGKNPTRDSLLKAYRSWNEANPFLLPGVKQRTGVSGQFPLKCERIIKYTNAVFQPVSGTKCATSGT